MKIYRKKTKDSNLKFKKFKNKIGYFKSWNKSLQNKIKVSKVLLNYKTI